MDEATKDELKTCPTCGARCFADAEVCYGCLGRFDNEEKEAREAREAKDAPAQAQPREQGQRQAWAQSATCSVVNGPIPPRQKPPVVHAMAQPEAPFQVVVTIRVIGGDCVCLEQPS